MSSEWTIDTLHEHIKQRLDDLVVLLNERDVASDKAVTAALSAAKEAVIKAEGATDKRLEALNELRGVVSDISALQMPRLEAEQRLSTQGASIMTLTGRVSKIEDTKAGGISAYTGLYAAIAAAASLVSIVVVLVR